MLYPVYAYDYYVPSHGYLERLTMVSGFLDEDFNTVIEGTYSNFYFLDGCLYALSAQTGLVEVFDLTGRLIVALPGGGYVWGAKNNQYFIRNSGGGGRYSNLYDTSGNVLYSDAVISFIKDDKFLMTTWDADTYQDNSEIFDAATRETIPLEFDRNGPDGSWRDLGTFQYYSGYDGLLAPLVDHNSYAGQTTIVLYFTLSGTTVPPNATYRVVDQEETSPYDIQTREYRNISPFTYVWIDAIDGVQIRPGGLYAMDGEPILAAQIDFAKNSPLLQHYWVRIGSVEGYVDKTGTWLYRQPTYGWLND
jgi:hypothetical protein